MEKAKILEAFGPDGMYGFAHFPFFNYKIVFSRSLQIHVLKAKNVSNPTLNYGVVNVFKFGDKFVHCGANLYHLNSTRIYVFLISTHLDKFTIEMR